MSIKDSFYCKGPTIFLNLLIKTLLLNESLFSNERGCGDVPKFRLYFCFSYSVFFLLHFLNFLSFPFFEYVMLVICPIFLVNVRVKDFWSANSVNPVFLANVLHATICFCPPLERDKHLKLMHRDASGNKRKIDIEHKCLYIIKENKSARRCNLFSV